MSDDHLWFSLFHEAAHILLHGRRDIFVHDATKGKFTELDVEANQWAANFLIPETFLAAVHRLVSLQQSPCARLR